MKTIYDTTVAGSLTQFDGSLTRDESGMLHAVGTGPYQWIGQFALATPISISEFSARDRLEVDVIFRSRPTVGVGDPLFKIAINNTGFVLDETVSSVMALNTPRTFHIVLSAADFVAIGGTISAILINLASPMSVDITGVRMVNTDNGSDRVPFTGTPPMLNGLPAPPANHFARCRVDSLPVSPYSAQHRSAAGLSALPVHIDWGVAPFGIPFNWDQAPTCPTVALGTIAYADESDMQTGDLLPVPTGYKVEDGTDKHYIYIKDKKCIAVWKWFPDTQPTLDDLIEIYGPTHPAVGTVTLPFAGSVTIWHFDALSFRERRRTSEDLAGLRIYDYLLKVEDILAGDVGHALRWTFNTVAGPQWPATHKDAGPYYCSTGLDQTEPNAIVPPLGSRWRLRADYPTAGMNAESLIVATAMKQYGIVTADKGYPLSISGTTDSRWSAYDFSGLTGIHFSDFDEVDFT